MITVSSKVTLVSMGGRSSQLGLPSETVSQITEGRNISKCARRVCRHRAGGGGHLRVKILPCQSKEPNLVLSSPEENEMRGNKRPL